MEVIANWTWLISRDTNEDFLFGWCNWIGYGVWNVCSKSAIELEWCKCLERDCAIEQTF